MPTISDEYAAAQFNEAWEAFVLAVRQAQARGQRQPSERLTLSQYYLLQPLDDGSSKSLSELAARAGIAGPTATRAIDGLERDGLLIRERSPDDRRAVLIFLTPDGRRELKRKRRRLARRRQRLYERLEPDERGQSVQLLRHLAELLREL
jgi:DNA-binding MarR family transcriptional regulator